MMWLKGCNKCGGDLHAFQDIYGSYVSCLQCGREVGFKTTNASPIPPPKKVARASGKGKKELELVA